MTADIYHRRGEQSNQNVPEERALPKATGIGLPAL
jgi:hypothetical protein